MLGSVLRDLWRFRVLARTLALRDTKAKYRSSLLGFFWAIVPPVVAAIGLTTARNAGMLNLGKTPIPYPAYVVLGFSLWQIFSAALQKPLLGLAASRHLLTKVDFPREIIVLSELGKLLVSTLIHGVLVAVVFVFYQVPVPPTAVLVVVPVLVLILLGLALGLLLAPVASLIGDISGGLPMFLGALFLVTPVVYPTPSNDGLFARIVQMNPLTLLFDAARYLVSVGYPENLLALGFLFGAVAGTLAVALVVFRTAMPVVVERWSA